MANRTKKRDRLGNRPICLSCKFFEGCDFLLQAVKENEAPSIAFMGACGKWEEERRELPRVVCELDNELCISDAEGFGRCGDDVKECPGTMEKRE